MDMNNPLKFQILLREFQNNKFLPTDMLSKQYYLDILDKKIQGEFDRRIAEQLFERLASFFSQTIPIQNFVETYLDAEYKLLENIQSCKRDLAYLIEEKKFLSLKMKEMKNGYSVFSQYGNLNKNVFIVTIIEAKDLEPLEWKRINSSYVHISYNGYVAQTKAVESVNPKFNESFEL